MKKGIPSISEGLPYFFIGVSKVSILKNAIMDLIFSKKLLIWRQ